MKICSKCLRQYGDEVEFCEDDESPLKPFNDQAIRLTGKILDGRFQVEKKLAEGGMGEVFSGIQLSVNRPVAIKVLRPAMAVSEEYVNRFLREANIASTISHPNFVHIYDFGQDQENQVLYLAMEYLQGEDLYARMSQGRLPLTEAMEICIQILSALEAAHAANIVHRDLKPENIFLLDQPGIMVKVLDFGIAKELGKSNMTKTGQIFGTPDYMSPEQCLSQTDIDGRSDLYSLGCILHELIVGHPPFQSSSIIQILLAQVNDPVPDLRDSDVALPSGIHTILRTLLQKHPDDRYSSASAAKRAFENELERLVQDTAAQEAYQESVTQTQELRRQDSYAMTMVRTRQSSQLINLGSYENLPKPTDTVEEVAPAPPSRAPLLWAITGLLVLAAGAAVVGKDFFVAKPESGNPIDALLEAVRIVPEAIEDARQEMYTEHAGAEAEILARNTSIFATSMALTPKGQTPEPVRVSAGPKATQKSNALLDLRTPTSIETRARRQSRGLLPCYNQRQDPEAAGDVKFSFRILADGSVDGVKIDSTELGPKTTECIKSKVQGWSFGEAKIGAPIVNHQRTVTFGVKK